MRYVDGFLLTVPKKNVQAYRRMARQAGKVWREHGALEFRECVGDDLNIKQGVPFPRLMKLKRGETVFFSYSVQVPVAPRPRQREGHEGRTGCEMMEGKDMPFDPRRMAYGGFKVLVDL